MEPNPCPACAVHLTCTGTTACKSFRRYVSHGEKLSAGRIPATSGKGNAGIHNDAGRAWQTRKGIDP